MRLSGITAGDKVRIKVVGGTKIVIEKTDKICGNTAQIASPEDFNKILANLGADSTRRFKRLGLVP